SGCIEFGYTFQEEGCIELFVKDTGTGIPEDSKSLIFERFRQLDTGLKRQYEGLGLGLSIVKGLVEQLDGKMEIKSTVNEGTTMIFKLSYQPGYLSSEKEEEEAISPKDLSGKKIVVAEDDMNNFLLIKEMLTDAHAEVMHADNGQKTIELCRNPDGINLILMDIRMPVMDGIEALSKIKDINPDIPLIALTAYAYEEDKKRLLEAGFDEYLSKPVSQKELIEVIEKFI
ncbi:MAG: response regulator, partial [Bacteroidota bacterium]